MKGMSSMFRLAILMGLLIAGLSMNSYGQVGKKGEEKPKPVTQTITNKPMKKSTSPSNARRRITPEPTGGSASLEVTMNWIGARLTDATFYYSIEVGKGVGVGVYNDNGVVSYVNTINEQVLNNSFRVEKCILTVERTAISRNNTEVRQKLVIPFSDIDPSSITTEMVGDPGIEFKSSASSIVFIENGRQTSSSIIGIGIYKDEDSKKFGRAVKHAVKLCGGKRSPF